MVDVVRDSKTNNGYMSLHIASEQNYPHLILFLLKKGCSESINSVNNAGDSPLHVACARGNVLAATCLINSGSCLFVLNRLGQTCLSKSIMLQSVELVDVLITYCSVSGYCCC